MINFLKPVKINRFNGKSKKEGVLITKVICENCNTGFKVEHFGTCLAQDERGFVYFPKTKRKIPCVNCNKKNGIHFLGIPIVKLKKRKEKI